MSRPRISAFIFTCLSCRWQRIWPLEREPSSDVVVRAKEKAKRLVCERCGSGGELEVFWTNGWHGDQLARQVAHIEAKNHSSA